MGIVRRPRAPLRPYVRMVWAQEAPACARERRELMLPSAAPHVVLRIGGPAVEVFDERRSLRGEVLGTATVGGARSRPYIRAAAPRGRVVGAVLEPGAAPALLGVPGAELAEMHVPLGDLIGRARMEALQERLLATAGLDAPAQLLEDLLEAALARATPLHPAVGHALLRLGAGARVGEVVRDSGYSHRRFNDIFRSATGLPPKLFTRVCRFERLLTAMAAAPHTPPAALAAATGYSDQAHLSREFRELTGITLREYRRTAVPGSRHVALPGDEGDARTPAFADSDRARRLRRQLVAVQSGAVAAPVGEGQGVGPQGPLLPPEP